MELYCGAIVSARYAQGRNGRVPVPTSAVAQYLPFLRRYARALTGNQTSGDAYVAAALEALIEDPTVLEGSASPRVALYRLFTKIWNSVVVNGSGGSADKNLPAEQRLSNLTPKPRQAFL